MLTFFVTGGPRSKDIEAKKATLERLIPLVREGQLKIRCCTAFPELCQSACLHLVTKPHWSSRMRACMCVGCLDVCNCCAHSQVYAHCRTEDVALPDFKLALQRYRGGHLPGKLLFRF